MLPPPFYSYVDDVSDACFFLSFLNKEQAQAFGHLEVDMCPNFGHKVNKTGLSNCALCQ